MDQFSQNPFASIIGQGQSSPQGAAAQGAPQSSRGGMMMDNDPSMPGKTGDNSRPLMGAIQQLHNYIAMSSNAQEQNLIRNIIMMLTQMVERDQKAIMETGQEMPTPPSL